MRFEPVSKFAAAGLPLPERKTAGSAGYDFVVAEDTIVPAYNLCHDVMKGANELGKIYTLDEIASITKEFHAKPTLVPTGMKCYLDEGYYLELSVRSSCPLKYWLVLANGVGRE